MAPGLLEIYEKRVFLTFSLFGFLAIFNDFPLTGPFDEKKSIKKDFPGHEKKARVPPPRPRGLGGGTPHSGRSPELNQPLKS